MVELFYMPYGQTICVILRRQNITVEMIKHCRTRTESHKRPDRCRLLRSEWTLVFYAKQGSKKDGEMLYPEYEERTAYGALKLHSKCDYMIWTELECIIAGLMEL